MAAANPLICNIIKRPALSNKKLKLTLLSLHDKFLNLSENMGISDTKSHENKPTNSNK